MKPLSDVKIALTHMGYYYDAKHGSNAPGDVSLARNLDKGAFDMIIGGHSMIRFAWMIKVYGLKIINQLSHVNPISKMVLGLCKPLNGVNMLVVQTLSSKMVN